MCCQEVLIYKDCLCETLISWEECPECPKCITEFNERMADDICAECEEEEDDKEDDSKEGKEEEQ